MQLRVNAGLQGPEHNQSRSSIGISREYDDAEKWILREQSMSKSFRMSTRMWNEYSKNDFANTTPGRYNNPQWLLQLRL